jgi:hypothetical protein
MPLSRRLSAPFRPNRFSSTGQRCEPVGWFRRIPRREPTLQNIGIAVSKKCFQLGWTSADGITYHLTGFTSTDGGVPCRARQSKGWRKAEPDCKPTVKFVLLESHGAMPNRTGSPKRKSLSNLCGRSRRCWAAYRNRRMEVIWVFQCGIPFLSS